MTSSNTAPARRPQLVTALLVGAVVVVLGVASGLGVDNSTSATPAAPVPTVVTREVPAPSATRTPVQYVGIGTPVVARPPAAVATSVAAPTTSTPPTAQRTSTLPSAPRTSNAGVPQAVAPPPTCTPDMVTGLLDALLGSTGAGLLGGSGQLGGAGLLDGSGPLGGSGLLGGLLGTPSAGTAQDPVTGLFASLTQTSAQRVAAVAAPAAPTDLLSLVTRLLPTIAARTGTPAPATMQPLAAACARQLSGTLPLLAVLG